MPQTRAIQGHAFAALGAVGLIASLWSPWYSFQIPSSLLDQAAQTAQQYGILGPIISQGAALLRQLGPIHLNAWQVLTETPAALLVVGVVAGGLSLLAVAGSATGVSRIVLGVGIAGLLISLYRLAIPPGHGDVLHAAWGLYLAIAANLAVIAGGLLGGVAERASASPPATADPTGSEPVLTGWLTAHSVPPPGPR